jgi:DNA-binding transcriptional ArsR family regulator
MPAWRIPLREAAGTNGEVARRSCRFRSTGRTTLLRIHLSPRDVATLRLLPSLGPLGETLHSLNALRPQSDSVALSRWRRYVHATLDPGLRRIPATTVPRGGLAFATVADVRTDAVKREFATVANAILTAGSDHVDAGGDLYASSNGHLRNEIRELADACNVPQRRLYEICAYHRSAVAPVWSVVRAQHASDRASRARTMLEQGVEGLLNTLHPRLRWNSPTLSLLDSRDGEVHLDGRGLVLAPSFFLRKPALAFGLTTSDGAAILIYPVALDTDGSADIWTAVDAERALGKLLGRTRALILMMIASGTSTTGNIARQVGTSAAAVSQHLNVLRDARMITTHRHATGANHSITVRGLDLLDRWDCGA